MLRALVRFRSWLGLEEGPLLQSVRRRFVALDLETTGLDPRRDAIVSLAAVPFVEGVPGRGYVTLVDPERSIPAAATAVHGLTDGMVRGGPSLASALDAAEPVVQGSVLVGHHIGFDVAVLARARRALRLPPWRNHAIDTGRLAIALHPEWGHPSLERIAERLDVDLVGRHTAEGDALTAGRIFLALVPELTARRVRTVAELLWFQRLARSR
jgi:DNA polymerase III epsilon subunit-like protein